MATTLEPIGILAGVEPSTDRPITSTEHYTFTKAIRFKDGYPEKIGGWKGLTTNNDDTLVGAVRSTFSYVLSGRVRFLFGSNTSLYGLFGTALTNITPVKVATIAIANSLDTYHATLGNDPIATVLGSTTLTITDTAHKFQDGDSVTLSGSTAVNGVPAVEINAVQFIRATTINTFDIIVTTPATSSGSGGGAAVVRASGIVTVNAAANGLTDGERVKILDAVSFGGITDAQINLEHIIRNATTNTFDIITTGTSTSSVTGGGGAATTYQEPIDDGPADTLLGLGYGAGLYGIGLYGVSKTSLQTEPPRLWSHDRFGDLTISCPGGQGDIYSWDGDTLVAPVKVANSPPANYTFVSNNIVVALGYDSANAVAADNGVSWSDQGGLTAWSSGQAGSDAIEGAGKFISHAFARSEGLLFTTNQVYSFRYIGGQFIWQIRVLDSTIGLIGQNARVSALGIIYWMGIDNFYLWRGGNVEVIPSNSSTESTALKYVFDDMNFSQKEKIYAWYNQAHQEVWIHYPSAASNEPDRVIRVSTDRFEWSVDEMDRTSAEYPSVLAQTPYLVGTNNNIYLHENGTDDDDSPLDWQFTGPMKFGGTDLVRLAAFVPNQTIVGNAAVTINTRLYPGEANVASVSYPLDNDTGRVGAELNGRFVQYDISGNELGQSFQSGQWYHEVERESPK